MRKRAGIALAVLLATARAAADPIGTTQPPLHIESPSHVTTEGGSVLDLPPGYFLEDEQWAVLDTELRRLQDTETRLAAENKSLRASASSGAPWWALAAGAVVGAAFGVYAYEKYFD